MWGGKLVPPVKVSQLQGFPSALVACLIHPSLAFLQTPCESLQYPFCLLSILEACTFLLIFHYYLMLGFSQMELIAILYASACFFCLHAFLIFLDLLLLRTVLVLQQNWEGGMKIPHVPPDPHTHGLPHYQHSPPEGTCLPRMNLDGFFMLFALLEMLLNSSTSHVSSQPIPNLCTFKSLLLRSLVHMPSLCRLFLHTLPLQLEAVTFYLTSQSPLFVLLYGHFTSIQTGPWTILQGSCSHKRMLMSVLFL